MARITKSMFDAVKICLESGNSFKQTAQFMKLSADVVSMINAAETLEEYQAMMFERGQKQKQAAAINAKQKSETAPVVHEHQYSVTMQATHFMDGKLTDIINLLTGISAKLAVIIDDLYGTGEKKNAEPDH